MNKQEEDKQKQEIDELLREALEKFKKEKPFKPYVDDYCDCDQRCPKCGKKKRGWVPHYTMW